MSTEGSPISNADRSDPTGPASLPRPDPAPTSGGRIGLAPLRQAALAGHLRQLDLQFARWLGEVAGDPTPGRLLAAALASHRVGQGDVCLDLPAVAGRPLFPELPGLVAPTLVDWRKELTGWPAVGPPATGRGLAPLILDGADRLYLGRYWHYEQTAARAIAARAALWSGDIDRARLREGLGRLFTAPRAGEPDWQQVAAAMAVLKPLCIISGGPGTGKTRTVTAILALLIEQSLASRGTQGGAQGGATTAQTPRSAGSPLGAVAAGAPLLPRIGLAAPTGKAAARLTESIRSAKSAFLVAGALNPEVAAAIPEEALTLHRLLGTRPGRVAPRHGLDNPLHLDLLVVDEASMLDLPLAARLLEALPPGCRLILLGDRDQLASVQAGAVLGDICGWGREPAYSPTLAAALEETARVRRPDASDQGAQLRLDLDVGGARPPETMQTGLGDCVALLRRSYRFGPESAIQGLASAINQGDGPAALAVLDAGHEDAQRLALDLDHRPTALADFIAGFVVPRHRAVLEAKDPASALQSLGAYRVLCAVREGPFGLHSINCLAERALAATGLIRPELRPEGGRYPGRPLLVTANDYDLGLFNGDVGLLLPDPVTGAPYAWFEGPQGLRRLSPHRLPPVETLFAMTVHKSQGSEFDEVALVLPRRDSRALTRELIYTGVTRARRRVILVASAERLVTSVARRVERSSGLRDALWGRKVASSE
jgi:exodeoxyribonuclease V alpha subunit